jgi:hypothetical protein
MKDAVEKHNEVIQRRVRGEISMSSDEANLRLDSEKKKGYPLNTKKEALFFKIRSGPLHVLFATC